MQTARLPIAGILHRFCSGEKMKSKMFAMLCLFLAFTTTAWATGTQNLERLLDNYKEALIKAHCTIQKVHSYSKCEIDMRDGYRMRDDYYYKKGKLDATRECAETLIEAERKKGGY